MHTVRGEISKWLINEKIIKDMNVVKRWSYKKLLNFYFDIIKAMEKFGGVLDS